MWARRAIDAPGHGERGDPVGPHQLRADDNSQDDRSEEGGLEPERLVVAEEPGEERCGAGKAAGQPGWPDADAEPSGEGRGEDGGYEGEQR